MQRSFPSLHALMPHEDAAELHVLRATLVSTWQPANTKELMQLDLIADAWLRMARANRYETELLNHQLEEIKRNSNVSTAPHPRDDRGVAIIMAQEENEQAFKIISRYSDRATSKYFRALACLEKMQTSRRRDERRAAAELASFGEDRILPDHGSNLASFGAAGDQPSDAGPHDPPQSVESEPLTLHATASQKTRHAGIPASSTAPRQSAVASLPAEHPAATPIRPKSGNGRKDTGHLSPS